MQPHFFRANLYSKFSTALIKQSLLAAVALLIVTTLAGCSSDTPPTEKEVSKMLKEFFDTCTPEKQWEEKIHSLGGIPPCEDGICGGVLPGYCQKNSACEEWQKENPPCPSNRVLPNDHFVSFTKTDGKLTTNAETGYEMLGKLMMFNSATGKNEDQDYSVYFDRREFGWHYLKYLGIVNWEFTIPR